MWPRRRPETEPTDAAAAPSNGSVAAVEQMANWVRFADTKATILAAGLGVVVSMFTNSADVVVKAIRCYVSRQAGRRGTGRCDGAVVPVDPSVGDSCNHASKSVPLQQVEPVRLAVVGGSYR